MIGRISFFRRLKESGDLISLLVSSIHDSVVVDAENNLYEICKILKASIEDIPMNFERLFGIKFNLPMKCDISYGINKGNLTTWTDDTLRGSF